MWGLDTFPKNEISRVLSSTREQAGGWWKFNHVKEQVDSDFKLVVRPAIDFLYSSAAIDAKHGPHVLQIPAMNRYWTEQIKFIPLTEYLSKKTAE